MIKFLPSYVGSKAYWVDYLSKYKGLDFIELFAGSSVLSANLANKAVLNDKDHYIYKIISEFDQQIIPENFTSEDYFKVRPQKDWYRYAYCLQRLSYSGVFRYSKNGYNVPIKDKDTCVNLKEDYELALERWTKLCPTVLNKEYYDCSYLIEKDSIVISDPPYENAQASYNGKFDYQFYWEFIRMNENKCKGLVVFDFEDNLPFGAQAIRKTRANGARKGNLEGIYIFEDSLKQGQKGEDLFYSLNKNKLTRGSGFEIDFRLSNGKGLELKSDYYDINRSKNFFFERYSDYEKKTNGGPWKALENKVDYFAYFFVKNKILYLFDTVKLVERLESLVNSEALIQIPNKSWFTAGYKLERQLFTDILIQEKHYD